MLSKRAYFCEKVIIFYTTEQIKKLIYQHRLDKFYNDRFWRHLSAEIKAEQRECQRCKRYGRVGKADVVHHVKHLKQAPELAYSRYYTDKDGVRTRQLEVLCYQCHNDVHPEKRGQYKRAKHPKFTTEEKW
ncbi:MAG: HNH endonuclease [Oscillospiraceae bacterium]|nr:HNH endonuclease [Oscillospiraceae bacterium]